MLRASIAKRRCGDSPRVPLASSRVSVPSLRDDVFPSLSTDGLKIYLTAVADGFGENIDYAVLVKVYGNDPGGEKRCSPAVCTGCEEKPKIGDPDPKHISTSYIERQNLTMRMSMRRFTRLTHAFSKELGNHVAAIALNCMYYNFVRIHQTLRVTPAMAAGVTDRLWSVADLVNLLG